MLGGAYAQGIDVARDSIEAVKWLRRGADHGDPLAQNALGFMCASGQGVPKDATEAVKWYRQAADQGYDQAQYNLGYSFENGEGVGMNYLEAVAWYRKAADQTHPEAQCNLGNCYYSGHGVQQDPVEACAWYSLAARRHEQAAAGRDKLTDSMSPGQLLDGLGRIKVLRAQFEARLLGLELLDWELPGLKDKAAEGDAEVQNRLAFRYYQGQGVAKNVAEAVKWWGKAAGQNLAEAQFS
jgi:hypothetical protein